MDIGLKLKKLREQHNLSQDALALKLFVSRQTISNWETNKTCPDIKSLITISYIFNVSLDNFLKEDLKEMREMVDKDTVKKFNVVSFAFLVEMLILGISAYPLFMIEGYTGIIIWIGLFLVTLYTSSKIEKFKKEHNLQTYKKILAFIDGKQLTYDEIQQEKGKRNYQTIVFVIIISLITLVICLITIAVYNHLL